MRSESKLIALLWTVIIVLVIGGTAATIMLVRHASDLEDANSQLTGNNDSLRRQLKEAKTTPTPTAVPLPTATQATPTPTPTAAPTATVTPKPTVKR